MISVTDPADPRLDPFRPLADRARRGADRERFLAESERVVQRLLASGLVVEAVLATPARATRLAPRVPASCALYAADLEVIRAAVGFDLHRGCVACARRPDLARSLDALAAALAARPRSLSVVAEGLSDPANLGALCRNARAFGADLLVIDPRGADPFEPRALRAAAGTTFELPLAAPPDLPAAVGALRAALGPDARVLAAAADGATAVPDLTLPRHAILVLGNEGRGLSPALRALADDVVRVPTAAEAPSLNVAAASAVLLYALTRGGPAP